MPSRQELNLRARNVGIDPANYPNDSKLEQRVIYEEKNSATEAGSLATATLTSNATNVSNNDTVTIGDRVYTFKTNLTEVLATATLTSNATIPEDGAQVSIGDRTYTFKTALSSNPTVPNEVLIGGSAAVALDNLLVAINAGATAGTNYSIGTVAHEKVTATTNTNTTQLIVAKVPGVLANGIGTNETSPTLSWGGTNMSGGVDPVQDEIKIGADAATTLDYLKDAINATAVVAGPGTGYSTGTKAHQDVTATTNTATTQVVQAISYDSGETVAIAKSAATYTWSGSGFLASGTPKVTAQVAADNAAISGGARV